MAAEQEVDLTQELPGDCESDDRVTSGPFSLVSHQHQLPHQQRQQQQPRLLQPPPPPPPPQQQQACQLRLVQTDVGLQAAISAAMLLHRVQYHAAARAAAAGDSSMIRREMAGAAEERWASHHGSSSSDPQLQITTPATRSESAYRGGLRWVAGSDARFAGGR